MTAKLSDNLSTNLIIPEVLSSKNNDLDRIAALIASGEISLLAEIPDHQRIEVIELVRDQRRKHLIKLIAMTLVDNLAAKA
ncbi:hypothetical protein [Gimesia sp.]|uniref:hypothetical protein n=1 Tax=Gimesia sp. TaxID=2024833 RepID=UPI003A90EB4C